MEKRKVVFTFLYWGIFTSAVALFLAYEALTFVRNIPPVARGSKIVFVRANSTLKEIARQLGNEEILAAPWKFKLLTRILRKERALKPGEYRFEFPSPPWAALRTLLEGKVVLHKVTFPEGYTMKEMARVLSEEDLVSYADFTALFNRRELLDHFAIPAATFEGFLFPDTYNFAKTDGHIRILETMVARFRQAITPENERRAKELRFDLVQWVTLASMIEKESSVVREHPIISSVFHNRLTKRMRLQSDPTVIYGMPDYKGNITKKDLQTATPYNTYTNYGLPPGPIANPGVSALSAAVNPAKTDFLYFVADKKGGHVFSKTYEEHLTNVAVYQLGKIPTHVPLPTKKKTSSTTLQP